MHNLPDDPKTTTNKVCKVRDKVTSQHSFYEYNFQIFPRVIVILYFSRNYCAYQLCSWSVLTMKFANLLSS